jgi:hypothetical protein
MALGCGRTASPAAPAAGPVPITKVLPLSELYTLEMSGVPPEDTAATFPTGKPHHVILRHGAPDNAVFVELIFPAETFATKGAPDSVTVSVHPRPGVYGVEIATTLPLERGALIRFKYPVHFAPPLAATARYGTAGQLERALAVAIRLEDGSYGLLESERPASDNLEAPLRGAGTYLVVAPR